MRALHWLGGAAFAVALPASTSHAQVNSNDLTLNNGGDVIFMYSSPSSGFTAAADPPDAAGDWYYKVYSGAGGMNHVTGLGSVMEVDGFYESLFDTFWGTVGSPASSAADFYARTLGPAVASTVNPGILEPAFVSSGFTGETLVLVGNSGFGNPCTVNPSLCSPPGSTCPPTGLVNGYLVELNFSSTPGTGVVLPADGTSSSDTAVTYFVTGGMTAVGGPCGLGDYGLQDVHSDDETQADVAAGLNPDGGFQLGGGPPLPEAVVSMAEFNLTFRVKILQVQASTAAGPVEVSDNGGGATNSLRLDTSSGLSSIGVEVRDLASSAVPNITVAGSSPLSIPNPGVPVFGGEANLLVVPAGTFAATSGAWVGSTAPTVFNFASEGAFTSPQLPAVPCLSGAVLHTQGVVVDLTFPVGSTFSHTNAMITALFGAAPCVSCVGNYPTLKINTTGDPLKDFTTPKFTPPDKPQIGGGQIKTGGVAVPIQSVGVNEASSMVEVELDGDRDNCCKECRVDFIQNALAFSRVGTYTGGATITKEFKGGADCTAPLLDAKKSPNPPFYANPGPFENNACDTKFDAKMFDPPGTTFDLVHKGKKLEKVTQTDSFVTWLVLECPEDSGAYTYAYHWEWKVEHVYELENNDGTTAELKDGWTACATTTASGVGKGPKTPVTTGMNSIDCLCPTENGF